MKHLTAINDLTKSDIESLFSIADKIKQGNFDQPLQHKVVALLFFENSTRTLVSFELAAKKLGAHVINVNIAKSSTQKGETLKDTILTIQAMGVDAFVIRHSENHICEQIKSWLNPHVSLINAGDGNHQHPSQALLDSYTIREQFQSFDELDVSIIGDIKHSRVASSFVDIAKILNFNSLTLFGPEELMISAENEIQIAKDMIHAVQNKDVVMMLRIQKERIDNLSSMNFDEYNDNFGLKKKHLNRLKPNSVVMHPGPFNRGVEIDSEVADNPPSKILDQVKNGVLIRQAILLKLLSQ